MIHKRHDYYKIVEIAFQSKVQYILKMMDNAPL